MKTHAAAVVALLALPSLAAHASAPATARQVIDNASAHVQKMGAQRWVTRAMRKVITSVPDTIAVYEQIGGGPAAAGEGSVHSSTNGPFATLPIGDRVSLMGSTTLDTRAGVRETHHVAASLDITTLEVAATAHEARTDHGHTRTVDVAATLPPRRPTNARERRLADRDGYFWPGKLRVSQRLYEPGVKGHGPARLDRTRSLTRSERTTDRGGVTPALDLGERDAATSMAAQLAFARAARSGKLAPSQRGAVTRALGEIDTLLARGGYTLTSRVDDDLNQVVASFPGGQRVTLVAMNAEDPMGTILLEDGPRRVEISHDARAIQVERQRPRTFAAGAGVEKRVLSSHGVGDRVRLERLISVERPLSAAEAARVAVDVSR